MNLAEARNNIGRTVIYTNGETGVITSVNDTFVFVRYGTNPGSKATHPTHLRFEFTERNPK